MNKENLKCTSCNKKISNIEYSTVFKCPDCNDFQVVRCGECRERGLKYECPKCGFEGPN